MSNQYQFELLAVGQVYPLPVPRGCAVAISEFLCPDSSLLVAAPDLSAKELKAFRRGKMMGGVLAEKGAILFLCQFFGADNQLVFSFESPFNVRLIPNLVLPSTDDQTNRLMIQVHIVDSASLILKGLRVITMPPQLTYDFLAAVQEQLVSFDKGSQQFKLWENTPISELINKTKMVQMGD